MQDAAGERVDALYSTANVGMFLCPCPQVLLVRNSLYFSPLFLPHILASMVLWAQLTNRLRRQDGLQVRGVGGSCGASMESMMQDLHAYV
jgi:hypothetical protein